MVAANDCLRKLPRGASANNTPASPILSCHYTTLSTFSFQPKGVDPSRYRSIAHQHFDEECVGVLQQPLRTNVSNILGRTAEQHVDQCSDDKMLGTRNLRQHFSKTHFLYLFLTLYLFADISIASNTTCYFPSGLESKGSPCNHTADVSTCCGPGIVCLGNGLCTPGKNAGNYKFFRGSCTDSTWKSSACPNFCLGRRCSHYFLKTLDSWTVTFS